MEFGSLYDLYDQGGKATMDISKIYSSATNMRVCSVRLSAFSCPSDMPQACTFTTPPITQHNYAANFGNTGIYADPQVPGSPPVIFGGAPFYATAAPTSAIFVRFADIVDGLSSTLMFGEVIQGQSISASAFDVRGLTWWGEGSGFETLLPPNANSGDIMMTAGYCQTNWDIPCDPVAYSLPNRPGNFAARSRHPGGVGVGLCDGSVSFISNTIAINTWRALSTTKGAEVVGEY
jgi:prepilin-type processing-associated H-X9-DG protein